MATIPGDEKVREHGIVCNTKKQVFPVSLFSTVNLAEQILHELAKRTNRVILTEI